MGMYTELVLKCHLKPTEESRPVLEYLFKNGELPSVLPKHSFFSCPRWDAIGRCCSFYHHPEALNSWVELDYTDGVYLFSRSDLKNYDNEIAEFLDWVRPYIDEVDDGAVIGYSWYEEASEPTLLRKK